MPLTHTESEVAPRTVPHRPEVVPAYTWDLTPLYRDENAWENDFKALQADYLQVLSFRGKVGTSAQELREALEFEKKIDVRVERLIQYASLRVAEDSSSDASLSREARLDSLRVRIGEAFSFLGPEIQAISDETFDRYLSHETLAEWVIRLQEAPAVETSHIIGE